MNYKKLFKNQELRFKILKCLKFIPDKWMIKIQYWIKLGRIPNLKSPERFTEKIQWYKLNYRNPLMTQCADKYSVREYVESKGLSNILNKLYAVYESVDEIEWESLPKKYVLKTSNGSGTNFLCDGKETFNQTVVEEKVKKWLSRDIYASGREWSYKNISPKIIVEEFLETDNEEFEGLNDYKFLCFRGKVEFIVFDVDRHSGHKRNIYDINWKNLNIGTDKLKVNKKVSKPEGLEEMINIAESLSSDFPFVRVDLYWLNGKIYFGELTFYPWTGYVQFDPDCFDFTLGKLFNLESINY